jgi:hypothetical protein
MSNFALLDKAKHQDLKIITERGAAYGDNIMHSMTFALEFRDVQSCYPIFFCKDSETGAFYPTALFGFEGGQNLFLTDSEWDAAYIPLTVRRHPFLIGFQPAPEIAEGERKPVVSIDMDNQRVNQENGEQIFDENGEPSTYLQKSIQMLENLHRGLEHNKGFVRALLKHELLESFTLEITLNDGSKNALQGFYTIAEEKLQTLDSDALGELHASAYLQPIFMALASFARVRTMIDKKNALLAA